MSSTKIVVFFSVCAAVLCAQQMADPNFDASVIHPAYATIRNRLARESDQLSGEAGMLTSQVFKEKGVDGSENLVGRTGMSVPGNDDKQYVLNVVHWLSGALK